MADKPDDKSSDGTGSAPPDGLPLGPLDRAAFLWQEAEMAAAMEAKLDQACQLAPPAAPGGNKLGARKDTSFKAICTAPSINWTPAGSAQVPVPYQTVQDLSNSMATARTVRFNRLPVYLLDQTTQPKGTGDERGTKKGIRSGTVTGEVKPVSGCKTVRIEGKQVVREGDECTMNGGNNPGLYICNTNSNLVKASGSQDSPQKDLATILEDLAHRNGITSTQRAIWGDKYDLSVARKHLPFKVGPQLKAWNPSEEEKRLQTTRNSISMFLLGPHGALGAIARMAGVSEQIVSESNELGGALLGLTSTLTIGPRFGQQSGQSRVRVPTTSPLGSGVKVMPVRTLHASKLGVEKGSYSYASPGPLPDDMAATFSGSRYTEHVLAQDTVLYRAGTKSQPLGQYFSMEAPGGVVQTRIDKAVLPRWPGGGESPIDTSFGIVVPAGTKVYVGKVANQGGFYTGGTQQIVVQRPWTIPGVKVVSQEPIK